MKRLEDANLFAFYANSGQCCKVVL